MPTSHLNGDPRHLAGAGWRPLVSVIIPCYNQAHFLADCLQSVLSQSYARIEIVVVNDGSPDDTARVAAKFPSIRYIEQVNGGLAEARNSGLRSSSGELLVFLDADDRLLPDAVASGVALLAEDPRIGFAAGFSRFISGDGTPLPTMQPTRTGEDAYIALLRRNSIRNPAMAMFRRSALDRVGGFDRRVAACADYDMYLRVSREFPVRFHATVVADYRKHGTNMSLDAALMLQQHQRVMRWQRPYLDSPARREAYREGCRSIANFYGDLVVTGMRARLRSRTGWRRTAKDIATLVRCHPRGVVEHALRKFGVWRRRRSESADTL